MFIINILASSSQCSDMVQMKALSDKTEYLESLKHKRTVLDQLLRLKIDQYQALCDKESVSSDKSDVPIKFIK